MAVSSKLRGLTSKFIRHNREIRALTGIEQYLACELDLFVRGGCRVALSAHPYIYKNRGSGADAGVTGITCYMVRPRRASYIGISQQRCASLIDGNSVTPAQMTSIKVKDKSLNMTAFAER